VLAVDVTSRTFLKEVAYLAAEAQGGFFIGGMIEWRA
jgi:hypothetical protein